jgi:hypothetical protein
MPKRGERQPYKVRFTYPSGGPAGVITHSRPSDAGYAGRDLLERGADILIEYAYEDGTRKTIVERAAGEEARGRYLDRVALAACLG